MLLDRIRGVFGRDALGHAIFYRHEPALRFELAGGTVPLDRFSQAYDRARRIAARAFENSTAVTVVLASSVVGGTDRKAMLGAARTCGVDVPVRRAYAVLPPEDGSGGGPARSLIAFEAQVQAVPRLLWGAVAQELGVRPRLMGDVYLADPARGVLLHPYDDRGLDVIGPNTDLLLGLYREFPHWLLSYDLGRMQAFFGDR